MRLPTLRPLRLMVQALEENELAQNAQGLEKGARKVIHVNVALPRALVVPILKTRQSIPHRQLLAKIPFIVLTLVSEHQVRFLSNQQHLLWILHPRIRTAPSRCTTMNKQLHLT